MAPCLKLFQFAEASNKAASLRQHCLAYFFELLLHTLSQRRMESCFKLVAPAYECFTLVAQDQACSDWWTAARRWRCVVAHSEMHLQNLFERFAKACSDFSMTINLKKTVVMSLVTSIPSRIVVNGSLRGRIQPVSLWKEGLISVIFGNHVSFAGSLM